jgi:hypothetical protein
VHEPATQQTPVPQHPAAQFTWQLAPPQSTLCVQQLFPPVHSTSDVVVGLAPAVIVSPHAPEPVQSTTQLAVALQMIAWGHDDEPPQLI